MCATYGADFAVANSGGLPDRLTCSAAGGGTGFCPSFAPPPYLITRGQVIAAVVALIIGARRRARASDVPLHGDTPAQS